MNNMKNKKEIFKLIHNSLKLDPKVISFADETNKFKVDMKYEWNLLECV